MTELKTDSNVNAVVAELLARASVELRDAAMRIQEASNLSCRDDLFELEAELDKLRQKLFDAR